MTSSHEVHRTIDDLLAATRDIERQLEDQGEDRAHEWMFALREILLDYQRVLPRISDLREVEDREQLTTRLREIAAALRYEVGPHTIGHLDDLLDSIDGNGVSDDPS